jgi:hypothetical protein
METVEQSDSTTDNRTPLFHLRYFQTHTPKRVLNCWYSIVSQCPILLQLTLESARDVPSKVLVRY